MIDQELVDALETVETHAARAVAALREAQRLLEEAFELLAKPVD